MSDCLLAEAPGKPESMSTALIPGEPARVIAELAAVHRADLIVVGRS